MQAASAAVLRRRDEPFAIEEIRLPEIGIGQILVKIAGTGICHTDLLLREGHLAGDWPIVLGHEGAGVVQEVGPSVAGIDIGDHVVLSFDSCGACANCFEGHPAYCHFFLARNLLGRGMGDAPIAQSLSGEDVAVRWFGQSSFASHVIATARNAVVIDPDMPLHLAGALGCSLLTGSATVTNVLRVRTGESLAILGTGAVGAAAVMAAARAGAARIVAVDLQKSRLDVAHDLGASHVVHAQEVDSLSEAILESGGPVSHVFDTTGNPGVIRSAIDAMAGRGVCAIVGVQRHDLVLGPQSLAGGKAVTAVYEGDAVPQIEIPRLVEWWRRGQFPIERLVTTYPLSSIDAAERDMAAGRVVKPVLLP